MDVYIGCKHRGALAGLAALALLFGGGATTVARAQSAPLTLDAAVTAALDRNRDLTEARLQLESAQQRAREAWSSVYPTLDLTTSYTRNLAVPANFLPRIFFDPDAGPDELVAVRFGADNAWALQLRAEQMLFHASVFLGLGAAARFEALQQEMVRGRALDVATSVKLAFYDVLLAEESLRLSENAVARVRQTLDETRKMYQAGVNSAYDVLRLEVELANVEPNLRRARNAAAAARRTLAVQVGLEPSDSLDLAGTLHELAGVPTEVVPTDVLLAGAGAATGAGMSAPPPQLMPIDEALALARAHRSELRQIELTAQLRRTELRAEQADYLPRVSLFGTYLINAQQSGSPAFFGRSDAERAYGRQVGVQVSVPLFAGFRRPARVGQLQSAYRQTQVQQEQLRDQVENQVRTLLAQVEETHARESARRFAAQQARRGFEIASVQYREGISSALEVTDAELALRQSEFNYAEAVYDALVARARFEQAVGVVPQVERATVVLTKGEPRQ
jgi:outer membrane protein